ncbi:MAG: M50 family metallopeptidase [Bacteroidota bacterium]
MIIIGILTALAGIAIVLTSRSITTFFHEMGHAIPALLFTDGPVTVYVGSYGDVSKSLKLNFGRLTIYFKFNFLDWNIGLCRHNGSGYLITELITILGGPLMSVVISVFLIIYMAKNGANENMAFLFGVFILSSFWDFLVNMYPSKTPYQLHDGGFIYSDGFQLKKMISESSFPDQYFNAVKKHQEKDYYGAAEELMALLKSGFKKREVYRLLVACLEKTGNVDQAIAHFEEFYQGFKFHTEDFGTLSNLFLKKGEYIRALNSIEKALHKDYTNVHYINTKGLILSGMGNWKMAIEQFSAALHHQPQFIDAYRNRGYAKLKIGETEEARADLNFALQEDPTSPYSHYYLAKYFEKKWQYVKALEHYEKAREMGIDLPGIDFEIEEARRLAR